MKPRDTKSLAPIDEMRGNLTKMAPEFKKALPAHITPEKFGRVVMTAIQGNPDLLLCDRNSFFGAAMKAAQDGLLPDGREAAFVIFNTKAGKMAVYMPMILGVLKKFRNSGECLSISCHVVCENDGFDYWTDENGEHLKHSPKFGDRGALRLAYSVARTKDGGIYIEVMDETEINKVRAVSRSKDSGPWAQWPSEMWRKTVFRRLAKKLPLSIDLERTVERDDELYNLKDVQEIKEPKTSSKRLNKIIEESEEPEEKTVVTKTPEGFKSESHETETKKRGPGRPPKVQPEKVEEPPPREPGDEDFIMFDETDKY